MVNIKSFFKAWFDLVIIILVIFKIVVSGVFLYNKEGKIGLSVGKSSAEAQVPPELTVEQIAALTKKKEKKEIERKRIFPEDFKEWELLESLEKRQKALIKREEELANREKRLNQLEKEIREKAVELGKTKKEIEALIAKKMEMDKAELDALAKIYDSTPPDKAGPLMDKLPVNIAAELFLRMRDRKAGKIKAFMDPERAIEVDRQIAKKR